MKLSENLSLTLKQASPEVKTEIFNRIQHYTREYIKASKEANPESAAYSFHELQQEEIDKQDKSNITCRKGCSFCCQMNVDITIDESILLLEYAKELNIEIDWAKIERQAAASEWKNLNASDRRCPFLSDNGTCDVYYHRPSACRKLNVVTEPKLCDTSTLNIVGRQSCLSAEILDCVMANAVESGSMAKMLIKAKQ